MEAQTQNVAHTPVASCWAARIAKGRAYFKHSEGTEGTICYYMQEPHHGTPHATLTINTNYGSMARDFGPMFAAAPDLLAACVALVAIERDGAVCGYCNCHRTKHPSTCPVAMARTAIAKAAGK